MDFLRNNLLTILIFLPTAGAVLTLMARGRDAARWTALAITAVTFALSLLLLFYYDWNAEGRYAYLQAPQGGVGEVRVAPLGVPVEAEQQQQRQRERDGSDRQCRPARRVPAPGEQHEDRPRRGQKDQDRQQVVSDEVHNVPLLLLLPSPLYSGERVRVWGCLSSVRRAEPLTPAYRGEGERSRQHRKNRRGQA